MEGEESRFTCLMAENNSGKHDGQNRRKRELSVGRCGLSVARYLIARFANSQFAVLAVPLFRLRLLPVDTTVVLCLLLQEVQESLRSFITVQLQRVLKERYG